MNPPARQFNADARRLAADLRHRGIINTALNKYAIKRDEKKALFQDWEGARQVAAEIKWDALSHLGQNLEKLAKALEARGTRVHWASTAEQARAIIVGIAKAKNARTIVKS